MRTLRRMLGILVVICMFCSLPGITAFADEKYTIFFEPDDGVDYIFNDNENKIIRLDLSSLNNAGLIEGQDYELTVRAGNWSDPAEGGESVFVEAPGITRTRTEYGYEFTCSGAQLYDFYEGGAGPGWVRFEAFADPVNGPDESAEGHLCEDTFFMPVRGTVADYDREYDRNLLTDWDGAINGEYNVYVENTENPDGRDFSYPVTNVEKIKDEPWNPADGAVIGDFHRDEDDTGHCWWYYRAANHGEAVFRVTYKDLNGEEQYYDFHVNVGTDVYEVRTFSETGFYKARPGETMDLFASAWHHSEIDDSIDGILYEWSIDGNGKQFASVEPVANEPWHARVTFYGLPDGEEHIREDVVVRAAIYDGADESGNPIFRAETNTRLNVASEYWQIVPAFIDGSMDSGQSVSGTWEVRHYPEDNGYGYEVIENADFWWYYDSNRVTVTDKDGNVVGNNDTAPVKGSQCDFTITRLGREDTDLHLYVFWRDENGEEEREEIHYHLDFRNYDIWTAEHDLEFFNDTAEPPALEFNLENLGNKKDELFDIVLKAGTWDERSGWKEILDPDRYSVSEKDGRMFIRLKKDYLESLDGCADIRIYAGVYLKDREQTPENLLSETDGWFHIRKAFSDYERMRDRSMLPGWGDSVPGRCSVYVENSEYPDGRALEYKIINVEKVRDDPWNPEDGDVIGEFHKDVSDENPEDYWWFFRAENHGEAAFKVTYLDLNGKEQSYEFRVFVGRDVYFMELNAAGGTHTALPGSAVDLYASVRHETEDGGESADAFTYKWEFADNGSDFARIEQDPAEPFRARVLFRELYADEDYIDEHFRVRAIAYNGNDEKTGEPLEVAREEIDLFICSDYVQIVPGEIENPGLGKPVTNLWELRHYPDENESGYSLIDNVRYRWSYDENCVMITDAEGKEVGNGKEPVAGTQCEFTFTRKKPWGTDVSLEAEWTEPNGNIRIERINYWLPELDCRIRFEPDQAAVYSDNITTVTLDTEELKGADGYEIVYEIGEIGENGDWKRTFEPGAFTDIRDNTITVYGEKIAKENLDGLNIHACAMYGEECIADAWCWIGLIEACEEHTWYDRIDKPATCTESGHMFRRCVVCNEEREEVIPAKGHVPGKPVKEKEKAATCAKEGSYDEVVYCIDCGVQISRTAKKTAKTNVHKLSKVAAKAATLTVKGNMLHYKCSVCGSLFKDSSGKTAATLASVTIPKLVHINTAKITGIGNRTYTGKTIKPVPKVTLKGKTLIKNTDYSVAYRNNTKAGKASVIISGKGKYGGSVTKTFTIGKAANQFTKVTSSKNINFSNLKKKAQSFTVAATVKEKAKKTYELSSVTKAAKKYISVSKKGKVTVKKGLKKGTYSLIVKITAAATANYKATTVKKTIRIEVK